MSQMNLSEYETELLDKVVVELFARRMYAIKGMSDTEIVSIGNECYKKATCLIVARRRTLESI